MHNANEKQVGGDHYATGGVQHWDYVQEALGGAYFMGNITKYVARHRRKNGLQDLEKALHYLQKAMELYQSERLYPPRSPGSGPPAGGRSGRRLHSFPASMSSTTRSTPFRSTPPAG